MDYRLVNELHALGPSVDLRRRNLQNLVLSLTAHEIRELGNSANFDLRTDIIARLPVELRLLVARHVDGVDVISFLNVSRSWRQVWLQEDMLKLVAKRWMPGFVQFFEQKEEITSTRQNMSRLFYEAAQRFRSRSLGEFQSILVETVTYGDFEYNIKDDWWIEKNLPLDPELHPPREEGKSPWVDLLPKTIKPQDIRNNTSRGFLYSKGRVAWQPALSNKASNESLQDLYRGLIVVDNLYDQLRKAFTMPDVVMRGGALELKALGSKLVVASLDRTLCAWDLETNNYGSVTLPLSDFRCFTHDHHVYIYPRLLTEQFWIYAWKFGGNLRDLDTKPLLKAIRDPPHRQPGSRWECMGILPHPLLDTTIYVVCRFGSNISLHKYTQGVYSTRHSFAISDEEGFSMERYLSERLSPINSFGKYAVAVLGRDIRIDEEYNRLTKQAFRLVCFDTLDESFSIETYHIPGWSLNAVTHDGLPEATWWNGELTSFARAGSFAELQSFRDRESWQLREGFKVYRNQPCEFVLATTRETSRIVDSDPCSEIPVHTPCLSFGTGHGRQTKMEELDQVMKAKINTKIGRCVHAHHLLRFVSPTTGPHWVLHRDDYQCFWADDDFLILRSLNNAGYVAWSFGSDMGSGPQKRQKKNSGHSGY